MHRIQQDPPTSYRVQMHYSSDADHYLPKRGRDENLNNVVDERYPWHMYLTRALARIVIRLSWPATGEAGRVRYSTMVLFDAGSPAKICIRCDVGPGRPYRALSEE